LLNINREENSFRRSFFISSRWKFLDHRNFSLIEKGLVTSYVVLCPHVSFHKFVGLHMNHFVNKLASRANCLPQELSSRLTLLVCCANACTTDGGFASLWFLTQDELSDTDSFRRTSTQFTLTNFGFYKGNRVSVKHIGTKSIDLTKGILLELTQVSVWKTILVFTPSQVVGRILRLPLFLKVHFRRICAAAKFSRSQCCCLFRVDKILWWRRGTSSWPESQERRWCRL